jgi:SAM-dependent methyltransferase
VSQEHGAWWNDAAYVREQYASEAGLAARRAVYGEITGPDARELAFAAVAEVSPRRVLEVGCGPGEASDRILRELGAEVVAVDISARMVELARSRDVDARVGDVQALEFGDGEFDCVLAAWMLYHVPDVDRGLAEIARVLHDGGRLVAVTNARDHLAELWELAGVQQLIYAFGAENGEELLRRHFARVERRDAFGTVTLDESAIRSYLGSSECARPYLHDLPPLDGPIVARRRPAVFVADKA